MTDETEDQKPVEAAPPAPPKKKGGRPRKHPVVAAPREPRAALASAEAKVELTDEEQVRIEVEAEIAKEARERDRKALKAKLTKEMREAKGLAEAQVQVTIDLAPYSDRLLIDNRAYLQGITYTVPVGRAQVILEQMQRTWGHQSIVDGKSENFYRKSRGQRVIPAGSGAAVVNTSQLLKA